RSIVAVANVCFESGIVGNYITIHFIQQTMEKNVIERCNTGPPHISTSLSATRIIPTNYSFCLGWTFTNYKLNSRHTTVEQS
ncbi:hypothetical protein BDFB_013625, partial [Asbolus verrucosus]